MDTARKPLRPCVSTRANVFPSFENRLAMVYMKELEWSPTALTVDEATWENAGDKTQGSVSVRPSAESAPCPGKSRHRTIWIRPFHKLSSGPDPGAPSACDLVAIWRISHPTRGKVATSLFLTMDGDL